MEGVENPSNPFFSSFLVRVIRTDVRDFLVITEDSANTGPSITNCAETAIPLLAERLSLSLNRLVAIEHYPIGQDARLDHTFDHMLFDASTVHVVHGFQPPHNPIPRVDQVSWRVMSRELARALESAGIEMTAHLGERGLFRERQRDVHREAVIGGYDGRNYYDENGDPIAGALEQIIVPRKILRNPM